MATHTLSSLHDLSDKDLLAEVTRLASRERHATAQLVASLAELDVRRLYLGEGCSSLFTYCTQVVHLSEHAAYGRIQAARAARRFPAVLELLADGAIHLTAVGLLAPHLTDGNCRAHNAYESERYFGSLFVREESRRSAWGCTPSGASTESAHEWFLHSCET